MKTIFRNFTSLREKRYAFIIYLISSSIFTYFIASFFLQNTKRHLFEVSSQISIENIFLLATSAILWFLISYTVFSIMDYFKESTEFIRNVYWAFFLAAFFISLGLLSDPGPRIIGVYYWFSRVMIGTFFLGSIVAISCLLISLSFKIIKNKKS